MNIRRMSKRARGMHRRGLGMLPIIALIVLLLGVPTFALFYPDIMRYFQMKSM